MELNQMITTSTEVDKIFAALIGFQKDCPEIKTNDAAKFATREGGERGYEYATLDNVIKVIQPVLGKHDLAVWQPLIGKAGVATMIIHKSGQWMQSISYMESTNNSPQDIGSVISYQKRYALVAALRLAISGDDDDGKKASEAKKPEMSPQNAKNQAAQATKTEATPNPQEQTDASYALVAALRLARNQAATPNPQEQTDARPKMTPVAIKKLIDRIAVASPALKKDLYEKAKLAFNILPDQDEKIKKAVGGF